MRKSLARRIARRDFWKNEGRNGKALNKVSALANSFGPPMNKPVCIRSMRKYMRLCGQLSKRELRQELSSCRVARACRYQARKNWWAAYGQEKR